MNTLHRIATLTAAAALTLPLTGTASATAAPYTYGDFSLMFQRSA